MIDKLNIGDISQFDKFALLGIEERFEGQERRRYGPVGKERASFYALECRIHKQEGEEKHIEFDKGMDPEEILSHLETNPHIAKHGIERLY